MKFIIRGFITHKEGESITDCNDYYGYNIDNHRFAVSDGVSISFFPFFWAKCLVDNFLKGNILENNNFIQEGYQQWQSYVEEQVNAPNVKWFTKKKYKNKEFAGATFIGLQFYKKTKEWACSYIGDSFLFFIPKNCGNDNSKIINYPKERFKEFDNYPNYLASTPNNDRGNIEISRRYSIEEGTFYLLTDALAEWFVYELKENILNAEITLKNIKSQLQYNEVVDKRRRWNRLGKILKNDDTTLLMIEVIDDNRDVFYYEVKHFEPINYD